MVERGKREDTLSEERTKWGRNGGSTGREGERVSREKESRERARTDDCME